ncbi:MAG: hypothetical protein OXJ52_00930 [Oligoflexia bacterium]|nr:hypothetical protein [Oligoflexia bacterium]
MPSHKKRINLTLDDSLYKQLEELRKIRKSPFLSSVVIDLTKKALEIEEDLYFSNIAKEREKESVISHKKIWKEK